MNVLILGSGGREHTLSWKIAQSPKCQNLFIAPGNAGTEALGTNLPISVNDFEAIRQAVIENAIDLVVVGPEDPLVNGIHDFFLADDRLKEVPVFGPQKAAAQLEGSKEFAKEFLMRHNIPTAAYQSFTEENLEDGYKFLETLEPPYVLKADGLAAGKGVLILDDLQEAKDELKSMISEAKFGNASSKVVIEEFLDGVELSVFVITDGKEYKVLPTAKDYKRIGEGNTGLNTGGMGAITPVPFADEAYMNLIEQSIIKPTVDGLQKDQLPYVGFIFFGLIDVKGTPKVIEYNVRMGDPETEAVIPRVKTDLLEALHAATHSKLSEVEFEIDPRACTTVMMVSGGYPEAYNKGKVITGFEQVEEAIVFHAGTKSQDGAIVTNGGRVISITAFGDTFQDALKLSYTGVEKLNFEGAYYRTDLGFDLQ